MDNMTNQLLRGLAAFAASAAFMLGQKPKSNDEIKALQAIQSAQQPDDRIIAVEALISKFADTEFKDWAFSAAAEAAQQKRDNPKALFYYEQAAKANPKNHNALLMMAALLAQTTRENDLDKEEKLNKAEKYVKTALEMIPTAEKPNPQVTDEQMAALKKDDTAQAHVDLGMIATVRKKYDVSINEYKMAVEGTSQPDAATMIRLAGAYSDGGKPDDSIATLDKVLAMTNLNPAIKSVADAEKARAQKMKTAK
jgi:tetratricopeptide (TPR) repeat protein